MNFCGFVMKDFSVKAKLTLLQQIIISQVSAVILFFMLVFKTLSETDVRLTGL